MKKTKIPQGVILKKQIEAERINKWIAAPMDLAAETGKFRIFAEDTSSDYKNLQNLFSLSSHFLLNYFPVNLKFDVRVFADINSFSEAAKRSVDPGWMGTPVRGDLNIIVMSAETEEETGNSMKFHSKILHEVSHIYLYHYLSGDGFSMISWLDEGICQWMESKGRSIFYNNNDFPGKMAEIYLEKSKDGIFIPLRDMTEDLCLLDNPPEYTYGPKASYGYARSFLTIDYFIDRYGEESFFNTVSEAVAKGKVEEWINSLSDDEPDKRIDIYLQNIYCKK